MLSIGKDGDFLRSIINEILNFSGKSTILLMGGGYDG